MATRRSYSGNAPSTTLSSGINNSELSLSVASATGYPAGGGSGPFVIVIDRGLATEEKLLIDSKSGTAFTVNAAGRGWDGTTAASHGPGAIVEHSISKTDLDEANDHIADTTNDDHTQYLNTSRHAAVAHTGAMLTDLTVATADIADGAVTSVKLASTAWTTYTPALTAAVTDPTLGAAAIQNGRYQRTGRLITGRASIVFGTSGVAAGSNEYHVSLPVAARTEGLNLNLQPLVGHGAIFDNSAANSYIFSLHLETSTVATLWLPTLSTSVTHSQPWAWNVSDEIHYTFQYEAAS